jgi:hypothetical protein
MRRGLLAKATNNNNSSTTSASIEEGNCTNSESGYHHKNREGFSGEPARIIAYLVSLRNLEQTIEGCH